MMLKPMIAAAAVLTAAALVPAVSAAPAKTAGKMVTLYQADKCHMYFTAAQAKQYKYACPDSKGKMKMVKVTPAMAQMQMSKTNAILMPKKAM